MLGVPFAAVPFPVVPRASGRSAIVNAALIKNVTGSSDELVMLPEALGAAALLELVALLEVVVSVFESVVAALVIVTVTVVPARVAVLSESQPVSVSAAVVEELVAVGRPVVPGMVALDGRVVGIEVVEVSAVPGRSVVEEDAEVKLAAGISAGRIKVALKVGTVVDDEVVKVLFAVTADAAVGVEVTGVVVRLGSVEIAELAVGVVIIQQSVVVAEALTGFLTADEFPVDDELSKNT